MDKKQLDATVEAIEAQVVSIRKHRFSPQDIVLTCDRIDDTIATLRDLLTGLPDNNPVTIADDPSLAETLPKGT